MILGLVSRRTASYLPKQKNLYGVLGVKKTASQNEIRDAFVKLSTKLHPDTKAEKEYERIGWNRKSPTEQFMEVCQIE